MSDATANPGNRLALEASPYLLQHASNPVDWWPWGDEAFAEAKRRDVPVLLSVGYSACHWCHVMEKESFSDAELAARMNDAFVCIKVDREERPDVDQIYQLVVQLMGRSGGWPLTVFLAPDGRPFFGGTYFPPADRYGMPGFPRVLDALSTAWRERRDEVIAQSAELAADVAKAARTPGEGAPEVPLGPDLLARASASMLKRFDRTNGGFGTKPKFPNAMALEVLLRRGTLEGDAEALDAVTRALDGMARGGIHDHLGGGFHRYATDATWLVPHFEKMLYDNALLLRLYAEASRAPGVEGGGRWAEVALGIAGWLAREMTRDDGALFAAADADSEGEEGRFFVWTPAELASVLEGDGLALRVALRAFGVTPEGNFEHTGRSVLHEAVPIAEVASALEVTEGVAADALVQAKTRLFAAREARPRPFRDDKVIAVWNGLALGALADAGACLDDPRLVAAAARGLDAVIAQLGRRTDDGLEVARHALGDRVVGRGFLDDHAALACAALDLYEATLEPRWVALAEDLARTLLARFRDESGALVMSASRDARLLCNPRDAFDGAVPSGAALACQALVRLGGLVGAPYDEAARRELESLAPAALAQPLGHAQVLCELDRLVNGATDVVVVGARTDVRTQALVRAVHGTWQPRRTLALIDPGDPATAHACRALAEGKTAGEHPVAYVCRGRVCSAPVADPAQLVALLRPG